ncbi:MAG: phytanoyl-CoA dioxygenase family protein [Ilumatobacteraceae bacterium]
MTATATDTRAVAALERLLADGYAVIENVLDPETTADLRNRLQRLLDDERAHPFDPGPDAPQPDADMGEWYTRIWDLSDDERRRLAQRQILQQQAEFDTPWPVPDEDVCISFIHIPTLFDNGRSQRIFNLITKDLAFAPLLEHPVVMAIVEDQLGRDAILLDVSVNAIGPHTPDGGWHIDSPLTQLPEPLPNFTLSLQTVWMLDEFRRENGATHVVRGSHLTLRKPPDGRGELEEEVVLEAPAGSLAIWFSQTWHRHAANSTDAMRRGVIMQYGRCWVKPFVDLRKPLTADQAASLSPRTRYMMGCNANAPVRG